MEAQHFGPYSISSAIGKNASGAAVARKTSEGNWRNDNARVNTCSVAGSPELYKG